MKTYAQLLTSAEVIVQDGGIDPGGSANQVFAAAEWEDTFPSALNKLSRYLPYKTIESMFLESRNGNASSTSAGHLVDATKAQFTASDVGKEIYNTSDKTWAIVTAYNSTSDLTLSDDIMASGEHYEIYNAGCFNNNQVNLSSILNYLQITFAEYPKGSNRKVEVEGDVMTISVNNVDDTSSSSANKEVLVHFDRPHFVSKLTDFAGAVASSAGYAKGDTTMAVDALQTAGTISTGQEFTIAGTRGLYRVTGDATIASSTASVTFYPGLASTVLDNAVVTFTQTTLKKAEHEDYLARIWAANAAISKATKSYAQVNTAITTVAAATTAIAAVSARISAATTDIASGRAESAKVSGILDTANTEIDKMLAQISAATTMIAAGSTEAAKIAAIVNAATTAITTVNTYVLAATTSIAAATSAIALGVTQIAAGTVQMALTDPQVDLAVTALAAGSALINTVPVGGGAAEYMGQASADISAAQGYAVTGQGFLQTASADFNNANSNLNLAGKNLETGGLKLREAEENLAVARADSNASQTWLNQAYGNIRVAQSYFQEAQGYVMESNTRMANNAGFINGAFAELRAADANVNNAIANLRLVATRCQISQTGVNIENWGRRELARVENDMIKSKGWPSVVSYPRD